MIHTIGIDDGEGRGDGDGEGRGDGDGGTTTVRAAPGIWTIAGVAAETVQRVSVSQITTPFTDERAKIEVPPATYTCLCVGST